MRTEMGWQKQLYLREWDLQVTGSIHAWFGGPGEASPARETANLGTPVFPHRPDRRICRTLSEKGKPAAPASRPCCPARAGQKKERMKFNNLAKVMVLGLAIFVAKGASAANKGTFQAHEAVEVNGQQLPVGEYQVRWEGDGPSVEIRFLMNNKEVAKTTAKAVQLKKAPSVDSSVVNRANGKAVVSELEFAGKRTALSLEESEPATMGSASR
ncbi:MAG TPA: hypothetical protein VKR59_02690 [Terriglobales bacterium]|nr:hypothetical protein [Terriglobales bacterium]